MSHTGPFFEKPSALTSPQCLCAAVLMSSSGKNMRVKTLAAIIASKWKNNPAATSSVKSKEKNKKEEASKTNPEAHRISKLHQLIFKGESRKPATESLLSMITVWLGQYAHYSNPLQGSCEYDEADRHLADMGFVTPCLSSSRDPRLAVSPRPCTGVECLVDLTALQSEDEGNEC